MDIAGIVCEFDPFHNGHAYLLNKVRKQGASGIVCVMSGDFVQRGGPALCDKFLRAEAAVRCGADLVLELPAVYAVNSADYFARGAVRILKGLGCIDTIAFGSESADEEMLCRIAAATAAESTEFSEAVKTGLSEGKSYPEAYQEALKTVHEGLDASVLSSPNDILALSYLREIIRQNAGFMPFAVKRSGAGHGEKSQCGPIASASYIRGQIASGNDAWQDKVPEEAKTAQALQKLTSGELALRKERLFAVVRQTAFAASGEELAGIAEISEGLENRLLSAVNSASSPDGIIGRITTSRYTASRASRILMQLILGITKDIVAYAEDDQTAYAKVLAFNEKGAEILRLAKENGTIPVYSNINKIQDKNAQNDPVLALDLRAADIYSVLCGRPASEYSDRVQIPKMLQI
ncbi:MAG: nucleotidyltransferase family protein [Firmicutes bacterium]|nr:nucleotidyltransferase family protein [Bacillota bacterium]MBQ3931322.1 nucleotidyltransferase family protein [Bacillota bacterium]